MHRRPAALLLVLAWALGGCGGTAPTPVAAGPTVGAPIEAPALPPTTSEVTGPPPTIPAVATTEVEPVTSPPAPRAPATTTPPLILPTVPVAPPVDETPAAACDPSYPGVCIPPGPPDLDCADVPYRRFSVVGADPHRFDADGDGIGCESG